MRMMIVVFQHLIMNGTSGPINIEYEIVDVFLKESFVDW